MSKYRITLDGKVYEMEIELVDLSPAGGGVAPAAGDATRVSSAASTPSSDVRIIDSSAHVETHINEGTVRSPMPGTVSAILAGPGDIVEKGQTVLVLEAMKMENDIAAPKNGTIGRMFVEAGETVRGAAPLFEMA